MNKVFFKTAILAIVSTVFLMGCGPADVGFANIDFKNEKSTKITEITMDGMIVKDTSGNNITVDGEATTEAYLEFVIEGSHNFVATFTTDKTLNATESINVNTSSSTTVTFDDPPVYGSVYLTNSGTGTIVAVTLCEEITSEPVDDATFEFTLIFGLPLLGLETGSSSTLKCEDGVGTYYVYTAIQPEGSDEFVWTNQGQVTLALNTTQTITAE